MLNVTAEFEMERYGEEFGSKADGYSNSLGVVKYEKLGLQYPLAGLEAPNKEAVKKAKGILVK